MKMIRMLYCLFCFSMLFFFACKKDFLEQKPSSKIVVPATLGDLQLLLNYTGINKVSALPLLSCDDYFIASRADWESGTPLERNCYIWGNDLYGGAPNDENWNLPYVSVFYANSVLSGLEKVAVAADQNTYHDVQGQAYFVRAFAFMDLLRNFAVPYDPKTATEEPGIPIRLSANVDEVVQRSSVEQGYRQVVSDLGKACRLLPVALPSGVNRASKPAAYALLGRLYLSNKDYTRAESYADSALSLYDRLLDYNTLDTSSHYPFDSNNPELLFFSIQNGTGFANALYNPYSNMGIVPELIDSYAEHDLRASVYFYQESGRFKPKRGYSAVSNAPFAGLSVDELYLIKAECAIRRVDISTGMEVLNKLLVKRFERGHFVPLSASTAEEALALVLKERRKELVWRAGARWDDLRRLNKEGFGISLIRQLGTEEHLLSANSNRYVFPIPQAEISQSGIDQNNRDDSAIKGF